MDTNALDTSSAVVDVSEIIEDISSMDARSRLSFLEDMLSGIGPKLLTAALVLLVGIVLIRLLLSFTRKVLRKSKLDPALHSFLISILGVASYVVLGVSVMAVLVPSAVNSLITILGAFGLAISLAVKDSLANLAGGMSILFTKPFALGDYVNINGNEGSIQEIRLNYTVMKTIDNKVVHIPNGDVAKAQIINYTGEPTRRLDINFSIGYGDDFELAKKIIHKAVSENPMALPDPEPVIRMVQHAENAVLVTCRVWCKTPDYITLQFDLLEAVKRGFDENGISIPFNHLYAGPREKA